MSCDFACYTTWVSRKSQINHNIVYLPHIPIVLKSRGNISAIENEIGQNDWILLKYVCFWRCAIIYNICAALWHQAHAIVINSLDEKLCFESWINKKLFLHKNEVIKLMLIMNKINFPTSFPLDFGLHFDW